MASTADRIRKIVADNFDFDGELDFDVKFTESGASSADFIAFFKIVNDEFGLGMVAGDCREFETLNELVKYIDRNAA